MTNINGYNFKDWLNFLVHEDLESERENFLYKWDYLEVIIHSSELFKRSSEVLGDIGTENLRKVLFTIKTNFLPAIAHPIIVPDVASGCVNNMWFLFVDVFAKCSMENLTRDWFHLWPSHSYTDNRPTLVTVNSAIFDLLRRLLMTRINKEIEISALVGLSFQLDTVRSQKIIREFLELNKSPDPKSMEFALGFFNEEKGEKAPGEKQKGSGTVEYEK